MDITSWLDLIASASAIRRLRRMQPAGGAGDKIFPPTYPADVRDGAPRHVFERRRIGGDNRLCVLVDSVQSQANRMEEALGLLRAQGTLPIPAISVDFSAVNDLADIGQIDTLHAPHRVFDAIIRDSRLGGKAFNETDEGKSLLLARPDCARAVFELSPTTLSFGGWNSTGTGGGLGAKFPRTLVSEIIGINVATETQGADGKDAREVPSGKRPGSRIDPLGIRAGVKVVKEEGGGWHIAANKEKGSVNPSEINHSNIAPSLMPLGVTVDYLLQTVVLSLPAIRRLVFTGTPGRPSDADRAAHAALAALGLVACLAQDRAGYALRSRCDLVPEEGAETGFQIVHPDGSTEAFALDLPGALALLSDALARAAKAGLAVRPSDLVLEPQPKLVELVRQSRARALKGEAEPETA